jgi:dTDP-4-amino-4,6-dideoxygalactose transaminase
MFVALKPAPFHGQTKEIGFQKDQFPVTEQVCDEILSLPMFPQLSEQQVNIVAAEVKEYLMDSSINP